MQFALALFVTDAGLQADLVEDMQERARASSSTFAIFLTSYSPVARSMAAASGSPLAAQTHVGWIPVTSTGMREVGVAVVPRVSAGAREGIAIGI
jgi:hypothetical protein